MYTSSNPDELLAKAFHTHASPLVQSARRKGNSGPVSSVIIQAGVRRWPLQHPVHGRVGAPVVAPVAPEYAELNANWLLLTYVTV